MSYLLYGTDLSAINGVGLNTILTIVSELGTSTDKFHDSKAFVSWLRLAPNNKISGSKVLSSRTPKGLNPLTIALRDAANVIGNQKNGELTMFLNA
ncbi:MAG: transposase [Saprospiraceae bacterium]|nr:transposase [Saprospiraceae bacterium]